MDRRAFVSHICKLIPLALLPQLPYRPRFESSSGNARFYLLTIDFAVPDQMTIGDLENYQHEVVDVQAFDRFDRAMMARQQLLARELRTTDGQGRWYYLFKDKAAYLTWDKQRPQYSADNKIRFQGASYEMTHAEIKRSPFAFLLPA